ncbi:MAG: hypothetical protein ACYDAO_05720 [Thermoplasmataceae archaeon]
MERKNAVLLLIFFSFQAVIYFLYYLNVSSSADVFISNLSYYLYIFLAWVELGVFLMLKESRQQILQSFKNMKGLIVLVSVLSIWIYILQVTIPGSDQIPYIFITLFTLVSFQEFNFRLISIEILGLNTRIGNAAIISAFLYLGFFSIYLFEYFGGYPGLYSIYFLIDTFAMGLIIAAVYAYTRSVYYTISITLSLYMVGLFPYTPAILAYLFVPV